MNTHRNSSLSFVLTAALCWIGISASLHAANAVDVTVTIEPASLRVGETATLKVFGRVNASLRAQSDRVFSWYLDLLNGNPTVASGNYGALLMPASDSPAGTTPTSSKGTTVGGNRLGLHNTFMNLPGAGVAAPVELIRLELTALAAGTASFSVRAGTSVPGLTHDFIVAPTGGGNPFTGGTYTAAMATLTVQASGGDPTLLRPRIERLAGGVRVLFTPQAGFNHVVESSETLNPGSWADLPGAPHNTGQVDDPSALTAPYRFYRIRFGP